MTQPTTTTTTGSVLKSLRALMPLRQLSYVESCQRAELQANRLLSLHGITGPAVPLEIVTELPRVRVERIYDMPVSGAAFWDGYSWVMTINASECELRQRFSLMHEFKHVLDNPFQRIMHAGPNPLPDDALERIADYFAACVLMPKRWVKTVFFSETQYIQQLALKFEVSRQAMSYRLDQLGLTESPPRCQSPWLSSQFTESPVTSRNRHIGLPTFGART
jgi:hypothetical protein